MMQALRRLGREPFVHFLVLGAGIFLVFGAVGRPDRAPRAAVVVTGGRVEQLVAGWSRTWNRAPTSEEMRGLIDEHIREELAYREALALGLDRDDTIVRRRLRQKMEFLAADLGGRPEPTDVDLAVYLEAHAEQYRVEPCVSFRQVYVSRGRRGARAAADAERLLAELRAAGDLEQAEAVGDALLVPHAYAQATPSEVAGLFGDAFAERVFELDVGQWGGPIESGYGLHLVYVETRTAGRALALAEVRDDVARDWRADQERAAIDAFYAGLRNRYTVRIEWPDPNPRPVAATP